MHLKVDRILTSITAYVEALLLEPHSIHCSGLSTHRAQIRLPVSRFGCCQQSSCSVTEHSVESVGNRLRQMARAECSAHAVLL